MRRKRKSVETQSEILKESFRWVEPGLIHFRSSASSETVALWLEPKLIRVANSCPAYKASRATLVDRSPHGSSIHILGRKASNNLFKDGVRRGDMGSSDPASPPTRRYQGIQSGAYPTRWGHSPAPWRGDPGSKRLHWPSTNSSSCAVKTAEAKRTLVFQHHCAKCQRCRSTLYQL